MLLNQRGASALRGAAAGRSLRTIFWLVSRTDQLPVGRSWRTDMPVGTMLPPVRRALLRPDGEFPTTNLWPDHGRPGNREVIWRAANGSGALAFSMRPRLGIFC